MPESSPEKQANSLAVLKIPDGHYAKTMAREWILFVENPAREAASVEASNGIIVKRVLDIGCGAGQELLPFSRAGAFAVGIDITVEAGRLGYALFEQSELSAKIAFLCGAGEQLPFASGSFDLVICRVALPYMDNVRALREMARVLRPGGRLILKIHHARYYWGEMMRAVRRPNLIAFLHSIRVLAAGSMFHLLGRQIRSEPFGPETFETVWIARRILQMEVRSHMPDSNPETPAVVFEKPGGEEFGHARQ